MKILNQADIVSENRSSDLKLGRTKSQLLFLALSLLFQALPVQVTASQDAPHCSSTFHVWQPGQDAQQMIRDVYFKVDNMTSYAKYELAELRVYIEQEVNRIHNWTYSVDRRVFQMQIDKMDDELMQTKFATGTSKVQTQLQQVSRRVDDLERSLYSIRSKLRSSRSSRNNNQYNLPQQQGITADLGVLLKNSVGDLKAEWLLLKRDVESLRKETRSSVETQNGIRNDTSSLKASLDTVVSETKQLEIKTYEVADMQHRLEAKMERVVSDTDQIRIMLDEQNVQISKQKESVETLQETAARLQRELNNVHVTLASTGDTALGPGRVYDGESAHPQNVILNEPRAEERTRGHLNTPRARETLSNNLTKIPKDCHEVYKAGFRVSAVYHIQPVAAKYMVPVYCQMLNNTGYTIIQRRLDGTLGFNRGWLEYQQGFGNPYGELWVGNDLLHQLSKQKQYTLRVDLWDWEGGQFFAEYSRFYVDSEADQYKLHLGGYTGNAGDSMSYHDNVAFSTEDSDNDLHERHCAAENKGGWWYSSCFYSQLNGLYHTAWYSQRQSNYADGIVWYTLKDSEFYSLRRVEMKMKPTTP